MIRTLALTALALLLAGCGGAEIQHTNAEQTDQLNAIADNTSETAGDARTQDPTNLEQAAQTAGAGVATRPRKY